VTFSIRPRPWHGIKCWRAFLFGQEPPIAAQVLSFLDFFFGFAEVLTMETNGNVQKKSNVAPMEMEMESLQPMPVRSSMQRHPIDQLWMLLKLHIEYYPKISTTIALTLIVLAFFAIMSSFQHPLARHRLAHDYSTIDRHYNFKASQIDHWCLFVS